MSLEQQLNQNRKLADSMIEGISDLIEEKKTIRKDIMRAPFIYIGYLIRQAALGTLISASAFCTYYGLSVCSTEPQGPRTKQEKTLSSRSEGYFLYTGFNHLEDLPQDYHR